MSSVKREGIKEVGKELPAASKKGGCGGGRCENSWAGAMARVALRAWPATRDIRRQETAPPMRRLVVQAIASRHCPLQVLPKSMHFSPGLRRKHDARTCWFGASPGGRPLKSGCGRMFLQPICADDTVSGKIHRAGRDSCLGVTRWEMRRARCKIFLRAAVF